MSIRSLAGLIRHQAEQRADEKALTFEDQTRTYRQLDERSSRLAQALDALGVGEQDRIGVLAKNTPEYFEILFAAAKLNAVTVAINWRLAPGEIRQILDDSKAVSLFVGKNFTRLVEPFRDELSHLRQVVVLDADRPVDDGFQSLLERFPPLDPGVEPRPGDVCCQIYTSGTTGLPKGVMLTHAGVLSQISSATPVTRFTPESVNLVAMPLFHVSGCGWGLMGFYSGCHNVLLAGANPGEIVRTIERHRITHAFFVVPLLETLRQAVEKGRADLSSLRSVAYGASAISPEVLQRALDTFGCAFTQGYGLTETSGAVIYLSPEDHTAHDCHPERLRSAGKPASGVEVRVVDPGSGSDVAEGAVGEIWIRGPQNMKGYWNQAEETSKTLTEDGWVRSGDAGYSCDDYLYLQDRVKDMVISGGENIYPAEVERVLADHPAVGEVAVIGVPDEKWGETIKAMVVGKAGLSSTAAELIAYCRENLAHYKCPTSVELVENLPRNEMGKILKSELREPFWKDHERRVN